jgi:hypothetical protein
MIGDGDALRVACEVLEHMLRAAKGAFAASTRRIAERPPRAGGVAWHPNGNHRSAQGGWNETGTGESQYSHTRRGVGAALAERCAAATAGSPGPSGLPPASTAGSAGKMPRAVRTRIDARAQNAGSGRAGHRSSLLAHTRSRNHSADRREFTRAGTMTAARPANDPALGAGLLNPN